jgi:phosphoglycolate phosphatase
MNIFFDLDGTLIDSKLRLYNLFKHLVPVTTYSYEEYWNLKSNKINHQQILVSNYNYTAQQFDDFEKSWLQEIEKKEWLAFDKPFDGITEMFSELSKQHHLYIVTARQSENEAIAQIAEFGWTPYIRKILVTKQKANKVDLIKKTIFVEPLDWFVGDTGKDIETGKILGIKTVAVLCGFLNLESLKPYNADYIINNTLEFKEIINGEI